jgi:transposase
VVDGFSGYLHADAFAGYQALSQWQELAADTHVACMAHARRKLFEVFETTSRRKAITVPFEYWSSLPF